MAATLHDQRRPKLSRPAKEFPLPTILLFTMSLGNYAAGNCWTWAGADNLVFGGLSGTDPEYHRTKLEAVLGPLPADIPATLDEARREFPGD